VLDDTEKMYVKSFVEHGGHLVILGVDTTGLPSSPNISVLSYDPAATFYTGLLRDFAAASANPPTEFLKAADAKSEVELSAPATVAANFGIVDGTAHIFIANFGGLVPNKVAVQEPARGIVVKMPSAMGDTLTFLPFLGETQVVKGEKKGGEIEFVLPPVERGAVVWAAGSK